MSTPRKKNVPPRIAAPPVYRPSPTPVVLQAKSALPGRLKPATLSNTKRRPVAPPVYRPQPVTKVMQTKLANRPALVRASRPLPVNQKWPGAGTIQRAAEPVAAAVEEQQEVAAAPEEKKEAPVRKERKRGEGMVWNKLVGIGLPADKHVLEQLSTSRDLGIGKKVSVVTQAVAQAARDAIEDHVREHGWVSAGAITIQWVDGDKCFKVICQGNQWMTHVDSGQLWPLSGPGVYTPPVPQTKPQVEVIKKYIKKWKGSKVRPV